MKYRLIVLVEKLKLWIVWHLPRELIYWATIRAGVHATTGKWSGEETPGVTIADILKRWKE